MSLPDLSSLALDVEMDGRGGKQRGGSQYPPRYNPWQPSYDPMRAMNDRNYMPFAPRNAEEARAYKVQAAERTRQANAEQRKREDAIVASALRVRTKVEAMIAESEKAGQPIFGRQYTDLWKVQYKQDRYANRRQEINAEVRKGNLNARYGQKGYEIHRNPTPPKRRKEPFTVRVSKGPYEPVARDAEVYRWVEIPGTELDDDEYVNYRRAHEESTIRLYKHTQYRDAHPFGIVPRDKRFDRLSPLAPDRYDFRNMEELYYEAWNAGDFFVMRMDNPDNFPDPRIELQRKEDERRAAAEAEEERKRTEQAERLRLQQEEQARQDAERAELARLAEEKAQAEAQGQRDAAAVEEARIQGEIIDTEYVPVPMPWGNANGFYDSIAVLRSLAGFLPREGSQGVQQCQLLRREAAMWMAAMHKPNTFSADAAVGSEPRRRYNLFLDRDRFRHHFAGLPLDAEPPEYKRFRMGMPRAKFILDTKRQQADAPALNYASAPVYSSDKKTKLGTLLHNFTHSQAVQDGDDAWPTLYEVEALAWKLNEGPIMLYSNVGARKEDGTYTQNWNQAYPKGLGPSSNTSGDPSLGPVRDPSAFAFRLLWSHDEAMRFVPLVPRDQLQQATALVTAYAFATRVNEVRMFPGVFGEAGEDDKWNGAHRK